MSSACAAGVVVGRGPVAEEHLRRTRYAVVGAALGCCCGVG